MELQEKKRVVSVREGSCVVLRAEARWWERPDGGNDLLSTTYRQAAEAFLSWAERTVGEMAKRELVQWGQERTHRFSRYGCRYAVSTDWDAATGCFTVTTTATLERAGQGTLAEERRTFLWDEGGTLKPQGRRFSGRKIGKKVQKK